MASVSSMVLVLLSLFSLVLGAPGGDGSEIVKSQEDEGSFSLGGLVGFFSDYLSDEGDAVVAPEKDHLGEITGLGDGRQFNPATVTFEDYAFAYSSDQCCAKCKVGHADTQMFVFSKTSMFCGCYIAKEGIQPETWATSSILDENEKIPSPVAGVCVPAITTTTTTAPVTTTTSEVKEVAVVDPSVAVVQDIVEEDPIVLDASGTAGLSETLPPSKLPEALALTTTKKECADSDFNMDTDYPGNDFNVAEARSTHRRPTALACQKLCNDTVKCKFFTWSSSNARCYMKTSKSGTTYEKGAISGPKNCE